MMTMDELKMVKEALANGCSEIEGTAEMKRQFKAGIAKEYRVVKAVEENDSFVETWKFLDGPGYTGRHTYGNGEWFNRIGVEDGYFEPDSRASECIVYILCDRNGNALMAAGNGCGCNFPTPFQALGKFFEEKFPDCQSYEDWKAWLLSFRDPAIPQVAEWLNEAAYHRYQENWLFTSNITENRHIVGELDILGDKYYIFEETRVHSVCGKKWIEYTYAKNPKPATYETISFLAYRFNAKDVGDGMSEEEVNKEVKSLLCKMFGPMDFRSRPRNDDTSHNMIEFAGEYARTLPDYDVLYNLVRKLQGANGAFNRRDVENKLPELEAYASDNYFPNKRKGVEALLEKHPGAKLGYPLSFYYRNLVS